jgi:hypothetical protein
MDAKKIIIIFVITFFLFFAIIIISILGINVGTITYTTIRDAFITKDFSKIDDPVERNFYIRMFNVVKQAQNEGKSNVNLALLVATFVTIENYDTNFNYDNVTDEMLYDLISNNYVLKKQLFCKYLIPRDVPIENEGDNIRKKTIDCDEGESCDCPPNYVLENTEIEYVVSNTKYKGYLKDTFLMLVSSDYFSKIKEDKLEEELNGKVADIFEIYAEILKNVEADVELSYFIMPVPDSHCVITSPYGPRIDPISGKPKVHRGIDIVTMKKDIYAAADGVVLATRNDVVGKDTSLGHGNVVFIKHDIDGIKYETTYAHLAYRSITVEAGDYVRAGQIIGVMGTTGYSTGVHLHFELKANDKYVDPSALFIGRCFQY